jgi:predicted RNA-binding protein YlqC (UPF0109 family)
MRELVEFIARSLVDEPDQLRLRVYEREQQTIIELHAAQGDLGKLIGRQGRTARAIRTVLAAAGSKAGRRYILDIVDE